MGLARTPLTVQINMSKIVVERGERGCLGAAMVRYLNLNKSKMELEMGKRGCLGTSMVREAIIKQIRVNSKAAMNSAVSLCI